MPVCQHSGELISGSVVERLSVYPFGCRPFEAGERVVLNGLKRVVFCLCHVLSLMPSLVLYFPVLVKQFAED